MRVGLVCPLSFTTLGGVQTHTLLLGQALQKQGIEVVYFSPTPTDIKTVPQPHVSVGLGVNLPNFNGSWSDYTFSFASGDELKKLLIEQKLDLLHVQAPLIPFINWQLIPASPIPVVVTLHSGWDKDAPVEQWLFFVEAITKQLKPQITQTIAVSQTAASCERYFADAATVIIPNPIDLKAYQIPQPRPKLLTIKTFNFLFVGRLDRRKGMSELLLALAKIPVDLRAQLKLFVLGAGPLEIEVKLLAETLDLTKQIVWLGRQSEKTKTAYLQHVDALIAPSLSGESFGMVLTEAMACGLPIICGNNRGYSETMKNYPAQDLVIDPRQSEVLAAAILKLSNQPQLTARLKKWELKEVKQYDAAKVATVHIKVYKKLLKI